ncbi:MAG: heme-binding protein [Dehalococcoidales bacterium]|nr:heme-binding protein [Dehalococcoidales bacterium]
MGPFGGAPEIWKSGKRIYGPGLTLEQARIMLAAGEKEALTQGVPMAMAICDQAGNLLAFHRMDNAILAGIHIAQDKAYTSVFGKQPTGANKASFVSGELVPLFFHDRWITFPGGFPLIRDNVIMGGLGVSGGIIEDCFVARAIMEAGKFSIQDVDAFLDQCKNDSKPA